MKPQSLRLALLLSIALNLGVIGAVVLDRIRPGTSTAAAPLHRVLELDATQRTRWEAAERPFLQQFDAAGSQLERHRTALIEALFADRIDPGRIESERTSIAQLQQAQQRLMIEQIIAERAILDARQRDKLRRLLLARPRTHGTVEDLHTR